MSDCISRQAAIKDAKSWVAVDEYEKHLQKIVIEWLKEFPSAEHGTNLAEVGTDCISRQSAIDALENDKAVISQIISGMSANDAQLDHYVAQHNQVVYDIDAIKQLPPTQPDVPDTNVGDMISRAKAIEALKQQAETMSEWSNRYAEQRKGILTAVNIVEDLPPAQPEIIRCKGCKHWIPYDWMFSEVWRSRNINDYPENEIGCKYCDMTMKADDFCSRAEMIEVTE